MNGKQQLIVGLMLVVGLAVRCFGEEQQQETKDVKELTSLRAQYEQAIKQVTRPIQERYRAQLEALVRQLGAAGKIEDAAVVQKALQDVALDLMADKTPAKNGKKEKWSPVGRWTWNTGTVTIYADGTLVTGVGEVFHWEAINANSISVAWGGAGAHIATFASNRKSFVITRPGRSEEYVGRWLGELDTEKTAIKRK